MDGVQASNEGVLILAATNAPWHLDPAFRRPGRFDRVLFVPPPDAAARAAILRILIKGKPTGDVDFEVVAKKADAFSGADIKAIIDLAVENKLREAMKDGLPKPLATKDLLNTAGAVKAGGAGRDVAGAPVAQWLNCRKSLISANPRPRSGCSAA